MSGLVRLQVGYNTMPTVSKTVYMPVDMAGDVEEAAENREQSDSEFIREATRRELQREEHNDE